MKGLRRYKRITVLGTRTTRQVHRIDKSKRGINKERKNIPIRLMKYSNRSRMTRLVKQSRNRTWSFSQNEGAKAAHVGSSCEKRIFFAPTNHVVTWLYRVFLDDRKEEEIQEESATLEPDRNPRLLVVFLCSFPPLAIQPTTIRR